MVYICTTELNYRTAKLNNNATELNSKTAELNNNTSWLSDEWRFFALLKRIFKEESFEVFLIGLTKKAS